MRVASRKRVNATVKHASIGVTAKVGELGLVREAGSTRSCEDCGNELYHEKYTDARTVKRVPQTGLSVEVEMKNRRTRKRTVATSALKSPTMDGTQTGTTIGAVSPTRVKCVSSHIEAHLGGMLETGTFFYR